MSAKDPYRIGILGIYHESNTFYDRPTDRDDFQNGHLYFGNSILSEYDRAYHELGGILEIFRQSRGMKVEVIPIMYAEATPGGIISAKTARWLVDLLMEKLDRAGPLTGLMVVPHGAAVSETERDFDGYWLELIRQHLGPDIPIIGTLDPHANLSRRMVAATDALIAYRTNPHIDQREVGKQAAQLMLDTLAGRFQPVQVARQPSVAISIEQQHTFVDPCLSLYQLAKDLQKQPGILSISILLGFPYADVAEMGSALIAVADRDTGPARAALQQLQKYLLDHHSDFNGEKIDVATAMERLETSSNPVLLLDMGDNVGGGGPGDGTYLLQALEKQADLQSFICICDPEAVTIIRERRPGDTIVIEVGGKSDDRHGPPVPVEATITALVDGRFSESEARHGGQVHFNMGETAILKTTNNTTIMITTHRTPPFSLQQLLHFKVEPDKFDCIVAKGVHAPVAAYGPVCNSIIRVNTPGITHADMRALPFQYRRRPLYPFEAITPLI